MATRPARGSFLIEMQLKRSSGTSFLWLISPLFLAAFLLDSTSIMCTHGREVPKPSPGTKPLNMIPTHR